jgi:hypothetical protein
MSWTSALASVVLCQASSVRNALRGRWPGVRGTRRCRRRSHGGRKLRSSRRPGMGGTPGSRAPPYGGGEGCDGGGELVFVTGERPDDGRHGALAGRRSSPAWGMNPRSPAQPPRTARRGVREDRQPKASSASSAPKSPDGPDRRCGPFREISRRSPTHGGTFCQESVRDWPGDLLWPPGWRGLYWWLSSQVPCFVSPCGRGSSWSARSGSAHQGAGEDERA